MNELRTTGHIRETDSEDYVFILSDESVDRYDTVIKSDAWDTSNYSNNPIVAYQHETSSGLMDSEYNPDYIIGSGEVWKEDGNLMLRIHFEDAENNELAGKIKNKIDAGILRSVSVGFAANDGHYGDGERGEDEDVYYFTSVDLLEASVVNIPANTNAVLQRNFKETIKNIEGTDKKKKSSLSTTRARAIIANLNII